MTQNAQTFYPAYCEPASEFRGKYYSETKHLKLTEVAKLIRLDIRLLIKNGLLPANLKVSVRSCQRGTYSIDIYVTGGLENIPVFNPERLIFEKSHPHTSCNVPQYAEPWLMIKRQLETILRQYNRDNSDSSVDYFDVHFYGHVGLAWEYERAIKLYEAGQV